MANFNKPRPWKRLNGQFIGTISNVDPQIHKEQPQIHISFTLEGDNGGVNEFLKFNQLRHQLMLGLLLDMGAVVVMPNRKELGAIAKEIKRLHSSSRFEITIGNNRSSGYNEIHHLELIHE